MRCLAICVMFTFLALPLPAFGASAAPGASDKQAPAKETPKKSSAKEPAKKSPATADQPKKVPAKEVKPAAAKNAVPCPPAKGGQKAESAKPPEAKACDTKPATYKVKKRLFKVEVTLDGVFEAKTAADVVLRPREWSEFEILRAVEHGTPVKPGDLLVSLETEKIDKAIADLERDLTLSRLGLQESELQLRMARSSAPLDLASSERSKRDIDQNLAQFLKVDRPMMERMVNFMVKMSEDQLAYEQEELRQLEKMYKADDLVEETEEIILRRTRDAVARAKFSVERAKTDRDSILKMSMPRAEEALKLAVQRQAIEFQKTQAAVPAAQRKLELGLEKMKVELGRSEERLKRLLADRQLMNVKAPIGGIVYYGKVVRGKWSGAETGADKLRRGSRLMADDVFMTIVEPRPLAVRAAASEKQLLWVTAGLKATVKPTALPDLRLTAIVERVSPVPGGAKDFDTSVTVALADEARAVMPGMTCEVKLVPYLNRHALAIPAAALGTDEIDAARQLVALPGKGDQPIKREVSVGKRTDKLVEIVKGLTVGEEILAEFPKEKE